MGSIHVKSAFRIRQRGNRCCSRESALYGYGSQRQVPVCSLSRQHRCSTIASGHLPVHNCTVGCFRKLQIWAKHTWSVRSTRLTWINAHDDLLRHNHRWIRHLNQGDEAMTTYEQLYLAMVILAFVTFGIVLATMSNRQGQK